MHKSIILHGSRVSPRVHLLRLFSGLLILTLLLAPTGHWLPPLAQIAVVL